jgi:2-methylaconitate cis-trans-isomerase PrpF
VVEHQKALSSLADDLPEDIQKRDETLLTIMGSGHELEIDGIGGGSPQTSKVAIVSKSTSQQADIDYLFVQVIVNERRVDTTPNCGNMLRSRRICYRKRTCRGEFPGNAGANQKRKYRHLC